uniref:Secreted protein n=1 Tax=Schistosoma curassoni TaxID=6186 RepID=A0A183JF62_9TREM
MLSILRRQLFINTCTFLMVVVVVLQVSAPYSRTPLTFVLNILTLILVESCFEFIFFNCRNAVLALPIPALTSASEPSCSSMMLPSYVKDSTSSKVPPSRVIGLVFSVLYLWTLAFRLCMLRPIVA